MHMTIRAETETVLAYAWCKACDWLNAQTTLRNWKCMLVHMMLACFLFVHMFKKIKTQTVVAYT